MRQDVDRLRAELAELRAQVAELRSTPRPADRGRISRRRLLAGLAGLGAAGATGVATASPAGAADGDTLVLGENNTATSPTTLTVSLDQAIQPDNAVRIVMDDPSEPVTLEHPQNPALLVESAFTAVTGYGMFNGVYGVTDHGAGVVGQALTDGGVALAGLSVRGPTAELQSDDGVTLLLTPASDPGPPARDHNYRVGSISVDRDGQPWLCVAAGTPGTWTRLLREDTTPGRTIPITPFRALDTRATGGRPSGSPAVPGQVKGPLNGGQVITLDLAGVNPVPTTASGVIGNLFAVTPTYNGYVRTAPSGEAFLATALSFTKGTSIGNAFTAKLGANGLSLRGSGTTTNAYHLVVDITAYIT